MVKLNVGGVPFTTTVETLASNSRYFQMLANGDEDQTGLSKAVMALEDGSLFFDKNGETFGYLLEWMREGVVPPLAKRSKVHAADQVPLLLLSTAVATLL